MLAPGEGTNAADHGVAVLDRQPRDRLPTFHAESRQSAEWVFETLQRAK